MNRFILRNASRFAAASALLSALCSPCFAAPAAPTASVGVDDNVRARALFRQGVDAFRAGKNAEAVDALTEAWAIRKTYDVAGALAQAELALGRYSAAAEHLDYCVNHFAPAESEQSLVQVQTALADVKQHVATLTVSVDRAGAEVQVDARIVGVSPLGAAVYVDPGVHTLQARLGSASASQVVNVQAGQAYPLSVQLGGASDLAPPSNLNTAEEPRSLLPVIIGGAVAAVGAAGFIAFSSKASSDDDQRQTLQNQHGRTGCADGSAPAADCAAQRDAAQSHDRNRNLATASAIVGALGLAAIPVYLLWPRSKEADAAPLESTSTVRVHLALALGGLSMMGEFQ